MFHAIFQVVGTALVWLRNDLRLDDNPALSNAVASGKPVAVLYVRDESHGDAGNAPHGAATWWLHHSLATMGEQLHSIGLKLGILSGPEAECVTGAVESCHATDVYWTRRYSPAAAKSDAAIAEHLQSKGIKVHISAGTLLREPENILHDGKPYRVFTSFWKAALKTPCRKPLDVPTQYNREMVVIPGSLPLDVLKLIPATGWDAGISSTWMPTSAGLDLVLRDLPGVIPDYDEKRDFPDSEHTSRLSPYLRFGQISVAWLMHVLDAMPEGPGRACYEKELHWREFAYYLLHHFPELVDEPLDPAFRKVRWRDDPDGFESWKRGLTGYPIVDAGMRQLWKIGWMHNRVRMITGSFLVKDLLIDWRKGARWFMDTLVDANESSNTLGWQWVAGCGPDAAPFHRIFNPVLQGRKFDPDGYYVRKYVPELTYLPDRWIHEPWNAPAEVLEEAEVVIGRDYPAPIVNHAQARERALGEIRRARAETRAEESVPA